MHDEFGLFTLNPKHKAIGALLSSTLTFHKSSRRMGYVDFV